MVRELDGGGVQRDAVKLALHLDRSRYVPHVSTFFASGMRFEELRHAGIPMLHAPVASVFSGKAVRAVLSLRRYLKQQKIGLVHSLDVSGVLGSVAAKLAGVPMITSQLSYRQILDPMTIRVLRFSDHLADAVFVNCEAMQRHMVEEGVPANRIEVCYNGVDTASFFPAEIARRPAELAGADLIIGSVCVLRPEKNLTLLQEAFSRLNVPGQSVKLALIGSGPELPRLKENAARLGITDSVVFISGKSDVVPWLRGIDVFVLCSYSEAFSNALLEAMACGCCVIGSRVGGTPEMIGNDERGLLFESNNAADLAEALRRVITDAELRRGLAQRAAAHAREKLSIAVNVARAADLYDKVLARTVGINKSR